MQHRQALNALITKIDKVMGIEMFEIIIISISQLIFPLSFIYPNEHNINPIYMNLSRGFITVITHLFILYFFGISFDLPSAGDVKVMLVRGTIITLQQLVHAGMFYVLSFSVLSTLAVTGPLFVFIIDYFLYNVSINRKQFLGIAFGVIGVIITINGDVIMTLIDQNYEIVSQFKNYKVHSIGLKALLSLFFVICNAGWAYSILLQKRISHINSTTISFYMGVQYVIFSGMLLCFGVVQPINLSQFVDTCVYSGSLVTLVQIMFIGALGLSKNSGILTLSIFLGILTSYLISHYRYGQKYNPLSIAGMVFLVYGIVKTTINKQK